MAKLEEIKFTNTAIDEARRALEVKQSVAYDQTAANTWLIIPGLVVESFFETFIIALSLIGNILVLTSIYTIRRLRGKKSNLFFVLSLTLADLLVTVTVMPFHLISNFLDSWPFGRVMCNIFLANDVFFCSASLLGIVCIAVERYIAVFNPLRYNSILTSRRSAIVIVTAWIISFALSHLPIHLNLQRRSTEDYNEDICLTPVNPIYAISASTITYWLPCCIMSFVYLRIYFGARKQLNQLNMAAPALVPEIWPFPVTHDLSVPTQTSSQIRLNCTSRPKMKLRTEVTFGRILGCFIICWMPFFVHLLLESFEVTAKLPTNWQSSLATAVVWLAYVNSTANPFIYAMSNPEIAEFINKTRDKWFTKSST